MTGRVDFYVLNSATPEQRWNVACRLTAKAYLQDLRVVIWNESAADAAACDELLWTFNEQAFVPHQITRDVQSMDPGTPVHLMLSLEALPAADMLVNLAGRLPSEPARFARIAEIIDADPERRRLGRERFKAYRDQNLTLQTHQLDRTAEL